MMKLEMIGTGVLLKVIRPDTTPSGRIVIPERAQHEDMVRFQVVSVGPGRLLDNGTRASMQVAAGDEVHLVVNQAPGIKDGEDQYIIVEEEQILCIVRTRWAGPSGLRIPSGTPERAKLTPV